MKYFPFAYEIELPLYLLFLLTLLVGFIIARIVCLFKEVELRIKIRSLESRLNKESDIKVKPHPSILRSFFLLEHKNEEQH
jgi:hypothetical protein